MNILDLLQAAGGIQPQAQGGTFQPPQTYGTPPIYDPSEGNAQDIVVQPEAKRRVAEDDRSEPALAKTQEIIPRKGMFGVKGTLRDVLGLIGDSLIMGKGGKAIYQPVREQEKLGNAIYGYNDNPTAAIDRAAIVDPEAAMKLQTQYDTGRRIDQQLASAKLIAQAKAQSTLGSYASTINSADKYALARPQLQKYAEANGLDVTFPEQYDATFMDDLLQRGMDPNEIVDNRRADASQVDQAEYRKTQAQISRMSAAERARHNKAMESRPTAQPKPDHGPGASNIDAQVLTAIQNGTANPAQQRYYDTRLAKSASGGKPSVLDKLRGNSGKGPPPPPNGGSFKKIK